MSPARLKHSWYLLFPALLALFLYRRSFRIWFLRDDFAWLGLRLSVNSVPEFFTALFSPMAQGTIRFLSERLFFLSFESAFGLESLPMRVWMFATLAVGLVFLTLVAKELSGSRLVGVAAAVFWSLNFGVTVAMCWLSSYNQILLSTLMLATLYCVMRGHLRWAWLCFLAGFGALESIIVLPAVLLVWALLYDRTKLRAILPMFVPAGAFAFAHLFLIPKTTSDPSYRMHWDASVLESLAIYWRWLLAATKLSSFSPDYLWLEWPALLGGSAMLLASLFFAWRQRRPMALFGLFFSLAAIAPMLPLKNHRTDYYLASASIGIMLSFASLLQSTPSALRWALALALGSYLYPSYLAQRDIFEWYLEATGPSRIIVRGAMRAHQLHPEQLIVLDGIPADLYNNTVADDGLRLISPTKIRLAPGNGPVGSTWVLSTEATRSALEKGVARIYRLEGPKLRDVTREWEQVRGPELAGGFAPEVMAGEAAFASQFGEGWYEAAQSSRWMSGRSLLRLGGGPYRAGAKLRLRGYAPETLGETRVSVSANKTLLGEQKVAAGEFILEFPLPASLLPESVLELEIRSSKTVRPPQDGRVLSLVFGDIGIR